MRQAGIRQVHVNTRHAHARPLRHHPHGRDTARVDHTCHLVSGPHHLEAHCGQRSANRQNHPPRPRWPLRCTTTGWPGSSRRPNRAAHDAARFAARASPALARAARPRGTPRIPADAPRRGPTPSIPLGTGRGAPHGRPHTSGSARSSTSIERCIPCPPAGRRTGCDHREPYGVRGALRPSVAVEPTQTENDLAELLPSDDGHHEHIHGTLHPAKSAPLPPLTAAQPSPSVGATAHPTTTQGCPGLIRRAKEIAR